MYRKFTNISLKLYKNERIFTLNIFNLCSVFLVVLFNYGSLYCGTCVCSFVNLNVHSLLFGSQCTKCLKNSSILAGMTLLGLDLFCTIIHFLFVLQLVVGLLFASRFAGKHRLGLSEPEKYILIEFSSGINVLAL